MRVVLVVMLALAVAGTASANLLSNGDFSAPGAGSQGNINDTFVIPSWSHWGTDGWYQNDIAGDLSVKYWGMGAGIYQNWDVTAGDVFTFSANAYQTTAEELTTETGYFKVEWYNSDYSTQLGLTTLDSITTADPNDTWITLSGVATAAPGAVHGRVVFGLEGTDGSGAAFFDDASVDTLVVPEPTTAALIGISLVGLLAMRRKARA
jgi:hypothetical protein